MIDYLVKAKAAQERSEGDGTDDFLQMKRNQANTYVQIAIADELYRLRKLKEAEMRGGKYGLVGNHDFAALYEDE